MLFFWFILLFTAGCVDVRSVFIVSLIYVQLDLTGNQLSGSLSLLSGCPKLTRLNLTSNPIKEVDALEPLVRFPFSQLLHQNCIYLIKINDFHCQLMLVLWVL